MVSDPCDSWRGVPMSPDNAVPIQWHGMFHRNYAVVTVEATREILDVAYLVSLLLVTFTVLCCPADRSPVVL